VSILEVGRRYYVAPNFQPMLHHKELLESYVTIIGFEARTDGRQVVLCSSDGDGLENKYTKKPFWKKGVVKPIFKERFSFTEDTEILKPPEHKRVENPVLESLKLMWEWLVRIFVLKGDNQK
jgi:hypothetical protein